MRETINISLVGNPNVGKSTLFNALTGLRQHTGNWPGKTVSSAVGNFRHKGRLYRITDLPGTYSLSARSEDERVTREHILNSPDDIVIIVCDGTCLERNLVLVLQLLEICSKVIVCINFEDELKRKGIEIKTEILSKSLGVPVCMLSARHRKNFEELLSCLDIKTDECCPVKVHYAIPVERAMAELEKNLKELHINSNAHTTALRLICEDAGIQSNAQLDQLKEKTLAAFREQGWDKERISDSISRSITLAAGEIYFKSVKITKPQYSKQDKTLDRIFTGKFTAYPVMLLALGVLIWLTICAANYPSAWLSSLFGKFEKMLEKFLILANTPRLLQNVLIDGAYTVLSCVAAVMLPPMAIFYPLFTLLEDLGYLPRAAYNLDKVFMQCGSCGKQSLTMCMGLGCTSVGITGCRIIDSPRERLLSALTCSFIPCNGKFPALIALCGIALGIAGVKCSSAVTALLLASLVSFAVCAALVVTKVLSHTALKGYSSSFVLEMPPYRAPQPGKILLRSLFDRTATTLWRAVKISAPAGIIIWLLSNIQIENKNILGIISSFLDPAADIFGLDGMILLAFILGLPANEIVLPIAMMGYMASGVMSADVSLDAMLSVLTKNGWDLRLAVCTIIFMLFHWPCSTSLITFRRETGSTKWTFICALLPSAVGLIICAAVSTLFRLFA